MILDAIVASTRIRVDKKKTEVSLKKIKVKAKALNSNTGFPFEKALTKNDINFICEVKRASPSKGLIVKNFQYVNIAKEYERAGAAAISVLTEPEYFLGDDKYLAEIEKEVSIPLLQKDFVIDEYQIYESKSLGASSVLLICSLLDTSILKEYILICNELGISAIVETHDEREIESALEAGARIIGVNNRNLKDFTVDINNSIYLREKVPSNIPFIAESGIKTAEDIQSLRNANVNGVLIGETLMKSKDKEMMLSQLRGCDYDTN